MARKWGVKKTKEMKDAFIEQYVKSDGMVSYALKNLNIPNYLYYDVWLKEDPDFKKRVEDSYEKVIDYVESKLFELIRNGDKTAILFYLKCHGKNRGYIERKQIEQTTTMNLNTPIQINIIPPQLQQPEEPNKLEIKEVKKIDKKNGD